MNFDPLKRLKEIRFDPVSLAKDIVSRGSMCITDAFLIHSFSLREYSDRISNCSTMRFWSTTKLKCSKWIKSLSSKNSGFEHYKIGWIKSASEMHMRPRETISFIKFSGSKKVLIQKKFWSSLFKKWIKIHFALYFFNIYLSSFLDSLLDLSRSFALSLAASRFSSPAKPNPPRLLISSTSFRIGLGARREFPNPPPRRRGRHPLTVRPRSTSTRTRLPSILRPSAYLYAPKYLLI